MSLPGWNKEASPYHPGEEALQARLGRKEHQEQMARQIHRPYMPEQHRDFFAQLPFVFVGSVDENGAPWASILYGDPGFIATPDDKSMSLNTAVIPGDPLANNLQPGSPIGLVGVELSSRRRNRMNGIVKAHNDQSIDVEVVQSYGNCPQYIQTRAMDYNNAAQTITPTAIEHFTELDEEATTLIRGADTLFVASYNDSDDLHSNGGADASHRGGKPGFVKVDGNTLTIPDYLGNFAFNTLGNFLVNPKGGLLFIDFTNGDLLQLTGSVELLWDKNEEIATFRGAERAWRLRIERGVRLKNALPMQWQFHEMSPVTELTGDWQQAQQALIAEEKKNTWRSYRVTRCVDESAAIRSIYLETNDDEGLPAHLPGQFLTVRVKSANAAYDIRTYTISSAPSEPGYRISIKRETSDNKPDGIVSNYLHDSIKAGDVIEALSPRGDFWMDTDQQRPALLIAAGVGVTPIIAMAKQAILDSTAKRHLRPITVIHAARTTNDRAFVDEFKQLVSASNGAMQYASVIGEPATGEVAGQHFTASGRIDESLLTQLIQQPDSDCYVCGPAEFLQSMYNILTSLNVSDNRIHAESFGPASLTRHAASEHKDTFTSTSEASVHFSKSDITATWTPDQGTLLEFAEAQGLSPNYGCRSGACGACAVSRSSGKTGYLHSPKLPGEEDKVFLCCAVPAASDEPLTIDL